MLHLLKLILSRLNHSLTLLNHSLLSHRQADHRHKLSHRRLQASSSHCLTHFRT